MTVLIFNRDNIVLFSQHIWSSLWTLVNTHPIWYAHLTDPNNPCRGPDDSPTLETFTS